MTKSRPKQINKQRSAGSTSAVEPPAGNTAGENSGNAMEIVEGRGDQGGTRSGTGGLTAANRPSSGVEAAAAGSIPAPTVSAPENSPGGDATSDVMVYLGRDNNPLETVLMYLRDFPEIGLVIMPIGDTVSRQHALIRAIVKAGASNEHIATAFDFDEEQLEDAIRRYFLPAEIPPTDPQHCSDSMEHEAAQDEIGRAHV